MTASAARQAQLAYGRSSLPVRTNRGTEYAVFMRVTQRMKAAAEQGRAGFPALAAAIHDNRRLWTTLAADVADSGNALPPDLRARIFYLAEFSFLHGAKVLAGTADVRPLLEINAAIMRGLAASGDPQRVASPEAPAVRPAPAHLGGGEGRDAAIARSPGGALR